MGLGKSAQGIRAADMLGCDRILVLCPAVGRINWSREFEKFSTRGFDGTVLLTAKDAGSLTGRTTICSYDLATGSERLSALLRSSTWDLLIADECHYLK